MTPGKLKAYVRADRYGGKNLGDASRINHVAYVCPSCHKTRAVGAA